MKIKVCGLKYPDNITDVAMLNPDYMGFICYIKSTRFISNLATDVLATLPPSVIKTAVFVNEEKDNIDKLIDEYRFDAVQLHGSESPDLCKKLLGSVQVIKAFGLDDQFDFGQLEDYVASVDYFLFDTKTPKHGGSGISFDWDILQKYPFNVPFFLSGGLSLDNLNEVKKIKHPQFYGVDLNSRFETEPGLKDIALLKQAFDILKQPDIQ